MIGFEALGWTAVFAFITCYSIAEQTVVDCSAMIDVALRRPFLVVFRDLPGPAGQLVEFGCATALFSLPQLLLALMGGWLARRVGLTARFTLAGHRAHGN